MFIFMKQINYCLLESVMQKETEEQIKAGTLKVDDGTDALTKVFGPEKSGYARGVGSGVTVKKFFHLPARNRNACNEEQVKILQAELAAERRGREDKDKIIKSLSAQVLETQAMVNKLMGRFDALQGDQLNSLSTAVPAIEERHLLY